MTDVAEIRGRPPIFCTTSSVSTDATLEKFDDANHSDTEGGYYIEWIPTAATADMSGNQQILSLNNGADLLYYDATAGTIKSTDGTNTASVSLTVVADTTYKIALAYDASNLNVAANGTWGTSQSYDGAFPAGTELDLMLSAGYVSRVRSLKRYNGSYDDVKSALDVLMA